MPNRSRGISTFLERYCPDPVGLEAAFQRELRVQTLHEGQALCSGSEEADCLWIVEEGLLQVMAGGGPPSDLEEPSPRARRGTHNGAQPADAVAGTYRSVVF
jgi:hypothetical protein